MSRHDWEELVQFSLVRSSLANIPEGQLVERLMDTPHWRGRVVNLRGIPSDVVHRLAVPMQGLPGQPQGDVDILLLTPECPEHAIAIEVKRVKVGETTFGNGKPNKLKELKKGIRQANTLANIGFSQVYYFVLVVVDSRYHNAGRVTYNGLTPPLKAIIDQAISPVGLLPRIGLVHFEFVQPMDDKPLSIGTYSGNLKRLAEPVSQTPEITAWVERVTARSRV